MKQAIQFILNLLGSITSLLSQTFTAKTEEEQLDHHTISISTR
jgi:hypothetical protein